jgi:hypothetical protein
MLLRGYINFDKAIMKAKFFHTSYQKLARTKFKSAYSSLVFMILYRFITEWWLENATPDGIEDLLIEDLDTDAMNRVIQEFHCASGGYDFKEFKKYLTQRGVRIIDVKPVDIIFNDRG